MTDSAPDGDGGHRPDDRDDPCQAGPCPGENVLAAWAGGDLLDEERAVVERHAARCEECRSVVAAVTAEVDARAGEAPRPARAARGAPWWTPLRVAVAAAAAVLLAVGVGIALRAGDPGTSETTYARLVASARELAAARPDLFAGFTPLTAEELRRAGDGPTRGAGELALLEPAGRILETRPRLRWTHVEGVARWRLAVRRADGREIVSGGVVGPTFAWPADAPGLEPGGVYQWEVLGAGPDGEERGSQVFEVATADERAAFQAAVGEIGSRAPASLRRLLEAHLAVREGFWLRAEEAATAALEAAPGDEDAAELLALVRRRGGSQGGGR